MYAKTDFFNVGSSLFRRCFLLRSWVIIFALHDLRYFCNFYWSHSKLIFQFKAFSCVSLASINSKASSFPRQETLGAFKLLKSSSFKFPSTGAKNCVQMPYPIAGFDGQFVYKRQDQRLWLSWRPFLVRDLLAKVNSLPLNSSILKDKTRVFRWRNLISPVQIAHHTHARFKFLTPRKERQSNARVLPGGNVKPWFDWRFILG